MICPKCKSEYRPGFTHCKDCDVDLIDHLVEPTPIERHDQTFSTLNDIREGEPATDLVIVETYRNEIEADVARTVLDAAGIPCTIWSDTSGYGAALVFTRGVRLLVASEDVKKARKILAQS